MSVIVKPYYLKHVAICNVLNIKKRSHKTNSLLSSNHSVGETPAPIVSEPQDHVQCTRESTDLRVSFWGLLIYHIFCEKNGVFGPQTSSLIVIPFGSNFSQKVGLQRRGGQQFF